MRKFRSLIACLNRCVAALPTIAARTSESARSTERLAQVEGFARENSQGED